MIDDIVREMVHTRLFALGRTLATPLKKDQAPRRSRMVYLLEKIAAAPGVDAVPESVHELQQLFYESFPIWVCQKQLVPLLFPAQERSIDLIIIDEATQCRVDDSLPILWRAKKSACRWG